MRTGYTALCRRIISGIMLAVLCLAVILPGCGKKEMAPYSPGDAWVEDTRERIREQISDPDKATKLLAQVDRMEEVLTDLDQELREYYETLDKLDEDYHSTRDDWQNAADGFNAYRSGVLDTLIDIVIEMKTIAGRKDWEAVSDMDETLYESWQRTYGS